MNIGDRINFKLPPWKEPLERYARLIIQRFSSDLHRLSDTGIPLEEKHRVVLTINPVANGEGPREDDTGNMGATELKEPMADTDFFEAWKEHARPLLLIAPFGCGKSVLLAQFAVRLARTLEAWCKKPEGDLPWVPFPVRLRAWQGTDTLESYLKGEAQSHVLSTDERYWLTPEQFLSLRDSERLLPLFDGLDELSDDAFFGRTTALSDIWQMFPRHHVLSSRPDNDAVATYRSKGTTHELYELDEATAKRYISQRLKIAEGDSGNPIWKQFRACQPHINKLFRRPLFLAAWCKRADVSPEDLPNTIPTLMEVLLRDVIDKRIIAEGEVQDRDLKQRIFDNRHCLGAVLAIHADIGYGVKFKGSVADVAARDHSHALSAETAMQFVRYALKAGLLIRHNEASYTQKIPIVEYLIGYYYAWLGRGSEDDSTRQAQRQLVTSFQRRLWWRDHDEVWKYAFEIMWANSHSQSQIAGSLVCWILDFSKLYLECLNFSTDQDFDLIPLRFDVFALQVLLPATRSPSELRSESDVFISKAFAHYSEIQIAIWLNLKKEDEHIEDVLNRRPQLLINWLLDCLESSRYDSALDLVCSALTYATGHFGHAHFKRLLRMLPASKCEGIKQEITDVLGIAAARIGRVATNELMLSLSIREYESVWDAVGQCLEQSSEHLSDDNLNTLFEFLGNIDMSRLQVSPPAQPDENRSNLLVVRDVMPLAIHNPMEGISLALARATARRGTKALDRLLAFLKANISSPNGSSIRLAFVRASALLGVAAFDRLLDYLIETDESDTLNTIQSAIEVVATESGAHVADRLAGCFGETRYKHRWYWIAGALRMALAFQSKRPKKELEKKPVEPQTDESYASWLVECLDRAFDYFPDDSPDLIHIFEIAVELLITLSDITDGYHPRAIIDSFGCSHGVFRMLKELAAKEANLGRTIQAKKVTELSSALIWFVRDVDPKKEPGGRVVYSVAERHDPNLILNADKRFAPLSIRRILELATVEEENACGESPADWKGPTEAIQELLIAVNAHLKSAEKMDAFRKALGSPRTRRSRLQQIVLPMVVTGFGTGVRRESVWYFKEKDSRSTSKGKKERKHNPDEDRDDRSQLRVNLWYLRQLRDACHAGLVDKINLAVLASRERQVSWLKRKMPVVICTFCGHIHRLKGLTAVAEGSTNGKGRRRIPQPVIGNCKVCMQSLSEPELAVEHPFKYLHCTNCRNDYAIAVTEGPWPLRENAKCWRANEACQKIDLAPYTLK